MKTQMRFQKILMLVSLIVTAITFVYGLFFLTGSLGYAGSYMTHVLVAPTVEGFVNTSQQFVETYVALAIVFIVLAALLFITSCHSRRKYYITNYIALGLFVAFALVMVIYILVMVIVTRNMFLNDINWTIVENNVMSEFPMNKNESYQFALGYVVAVIILCDALLLTLSTVWKILLIKGENALLAKSAQVKNQNVEEVA